MESSMRTNVYIHVVVSKRHEKRTRVDSPSGEEREPETPDIPVAHVNFQTLD